MGTVALDASVIIGFLDPADANHTRAVELLRPWLATGNVLVISASVYAEILVRPIQLGIDHGLETFLRDARIEVVPIDRSSARQAATLRARTHALRLPDAFALVTAMEKNATLLTLDARLQRTAKELGLAAQGPSE